MEKLKIIKHGVFQNLRSAFQDAIQMASANVCWQSGTEFLLEVSTYCQLKVCKKSYKNIKRAHCESLKDLLFKIESLLRFETLWVVYFSKIYNFDRWRIGLKGFPGVAGSNHCNVLFNGYRWDITWFNSIGKVQRTSWVHHLIRVLTWGCICWDFRFAHFGTLSRSDRPSAANLKSFCVIEIIRFI